ncbi:hypothetical protein ACHAXM_006377 [Skeletonema potamos]
MTAKNTPSAFLRCGGGAALCCIIILFGSVTLTSASFSCLSRIRTQLSSAQPHLSLRAAPQRLDENVQGILYVNDRCINCAACSNFAPTVFERGTKFKHIVYNQPTIQNRKELEEARAALAACPVAAIRVESKVQEESDEELKRALSIQPNGDSGVLFPRPITSDVDMRVYYLGHHNEASFGAIPYLVCGKSPDGADISVMVDVPRFCTSAVRAVKSLSPLGPDYLFLTHVDDTADHNKWAKEFPKMRRIFHVGDLGIHNWIGDETLENVEILLRGKADGGTNELMIWDINGNTMEDMKPIEENEFMILHTPGHSPGSISLLFRPNSLQNCNGVLFTGDTYSWTTRDGGHMSGFPRYGNDLSQQAQTLKMLGEFSYMWDVIAPGHGHLRSYMKFNEKENLAKIKADDINIAVSELLSY